MWIKITSVLILFQLLTSSGIARLPRDYLNRVEGFTNTARLLRKAAPSIQDSSNLDAASRTFKSLEDGILEELSWSGEDGYLLEVVVAENKLSRQGFILSGPTPLGSGSSPMDVLTVSMGEDRITVATPEGTKISWERSFYIWATVEPAWFGFTTELEYRSISTEFTVPLRQAAASAIMERNLVEQIIVEKRERVYAHAVSKLVEETNDDALRRELERINESRREARKELAIIEKRLARAVAREQSAAGLLTVLNTLRGIATVGSLISEVRGYFGDDLPNSDQLDSSTTSGEVIRYVEEIEIRSGNDVKILRRERTLNRSDLDKSVSKLKSALSKKGVPKNLLGPET